MRTCPASAAGSERAVGVKAAARRVPRGASLARARILQPRRQLTVSASARRASTPRRRARPTRSTGATSSGRGQSPAGTHPVGERAAPSKRSTRLLFVSATYTLPAQFTAIAAGWENAPRAVPRRPHFSRKRAPASNTCTRLFSPSSTYTSPAPSTVIPSGERKWPSVLRAADRGGAAELREEGPVAPQAQDPSRARVRHVQRPARIHRDAGGAVEPRPPRGHAVPHRGERVAGRGEQLQAVGDGVGHEQPAGGVGAEAPRRGHRAEGAPGGAEGAHEGALRIEHLDAP